MRTRGGPSASRSQTGALMTVVGQTRELFTQVAPPPPPPQLVKLAWLAFGGGDGGGKQIVILIMAQRCSAGELLCAGQAICLHLQPMPGRTGLLTGAPVASLRCPLLGQ